MSIQGLTSGLAHVVEAIVGLMLASILVLALGEVISRYFTGHSIVWVAEINRFLFVWLSFLGAAAAFHHRIHFRLALLWRFFEAEVRTRLELGVDGLAFAFAVALLVQSLELVGRTSTQRSAALLIRMSYVYSVIPLSAALILVFILLRWAEAVRARQLPDPAASERSE